MRSWGGRNEREGGRALPSWAGKTLTLTLNQGRRLMMKKGAKTKEEERTDFFFSRRHP